MPILYLLKYIYESVCSAGISVFFAGLLITSCVSPKKLAFFQSAQSNTDTLAVEAPFESTIRPGDVISIQVSSLNAEASSLFNPYTSIATADRLQTPTSGAAQPVSGYRVDKEGHIEMPLIGRISVKNLTTNQAGDLIKEKLKTQLKEPTVNVRNLNFRISVLGEVARPSLYTIPNEQITLPEALGLAGDLTIYGRRDNVLVVRETEGKRTFSHVDLTQRDIFRSPFYYLHPNDVIYIEPSKARIASVDRLYILTPIIVGVLSALAIIISRY